MEERADKLRGLRILVAEDEALVLMQIEEMLGDFGCKVVGPVSTVASTLTAIGNNELDGALLDMNLRGKGIMPAAEKLLAKGVPFLFVTGYGRPSAGALALKDAPRLTKPFTRQALSAAMVDAFTSEERANER